MSNAFARLWHAVAGETITTFTRIICLALVPGLLLLGYGPMFQANSVAYQNPIFDGVRSLRLEVWGAWFCIDGLLMLFAALTARLIWYVTAVVLSTITLFGWATIIVITDWTRPDVVLTSGAIGLYLLSGVAVLGLAFSPHQVAAERPIVAVTDTDEVIPLRRAG